jgi:hypothetical protein
LAASFCVLIGCWLVAASFSLVKLKVKNEVETGAPSPSRNDGFLDTLKEAQASDVCWLVAASFSLILNAISYLLYRISYNYSRRVQSIFQLLCLVLVFDNGTD